MTREKRNQPRYEAPQFNASAESILHDAKRLIEQTRTVQNHLISTVRPEAATFANTILPLVQCENGRLKEARVLEFYQNVAKDETLRSASRQAKQLLGDFAVESYMRENLFALIDAVYRKSEALDAESNRLLEEEHRSYRRNGLNLSSSQNRARFKQIQERLGHTKISYRQNLSDEDACIWIAREDLEGVPERVLSRLESGSDVTDGKLRLTFRQADLVPVMTFAAIPETRRRLYIANSNKCNQNVELLNEAIVLRDESARLLGFPSHAAFRLEEKMEKSPETIVEFLEDIRSRASSKVESEMEQLRSMKKKDLESRGKLFDGHFYLWDQAYYRRLMMEKEFSVDQNRTSEYFPISTTIPRLLEILGKLLALSFVEIEGDDRNYLAPSGDGRHTAWHEDVQLFSVWCNEERDDEESDFLGYLYIDCYARSGKSGQPTNFNLHPGFVTGDNRRSYPATALVCSFSKPTKTDPGLLKHSELCILIHELGHGIHDIVSKTKYARYHGTGTVQDFWEVPSQMLENWCWTYSTLRYLGQHYSTLSPEYEKAWRDKQTDCIGTQPVAPATIPEEMLLNLIRSRQVQNFQWLLGTLHVSVFDMTIHSPETHEAAKSINPSYLWNYLKKAMQKVDGPECEGLGYEWGHGQVLFGHLLGDYDAGVYGYLRSQVYALDMFKTVFNADPFDSSQGCRYRRTVLEKGGSEDEMQMMTEFLGRKPQTDAFYEEFGLV